MHIYIYIYIYIYAHRVISKNVQYCEVNEVAIVGLSNVGIIICDTTPCNAAEKYPQFCAKKRVLFRSDDYGNVMRVYFVRAALFRVPVLGTP